MIRKKSGIICWAMMSLVTVVTAQTTSKLSLKQCVETALQNNIQVKQSGLQTEREEVRWQQARANLLPNIGGNFNYGWNQGRTIDPITNGYINQQLTSSSLGFNSSVILFSGFQLQNAIKQTSLAYQAGKMEWEQAKNSLTLNVLLAYLVILNNEDILEISKNQEAVTKKQVERLEVLVKEGAIGEFQLADLKGQLASDQIAIINNSNALQTAKLNICQLMNIPFNKDIEIDREEFKKPAGLYEFTAEQVYQQSLENFAQVKAADLRVKSSEKSIKVAKGNYYPTLSFGANINSSYSSAALQAIPGSKTETVTGDYVKINNTQYDVLQLSQSFSFKKPGYGTQFNDNLGKSYGFSVQIPVFNNFQTRNQVKLANINLKDAELANANVKMILRQNIEQAHLNMSATYERYKALQDQVTNFEISFRAAEIRFNNGVINSAEYLFVKNNLDRSKANQVMAMYEYMLRTRVLDFYQVKLVW